MVKVNWPKKETGPKEEEFKSIFPTGTHPGILYGLPTVCKFVIDNILTFWLILSASNCL